MIFCEGIEAAWERAKLLRSWQDWTSKIVRASNKILGDNLFNIYIFGSLVRNEALAGSDIDILIMAKELPNSLIERVKIKMDILEEAGLPLVHPFEIHLVNEDEAEIYLIHIKDEFIKIQ
ncbi:MAG: nucleotidyltransferase domain-containing protein [Thermoproteota archaeon]